MSPRRMLQIAGTAELVTLILMLANMLTVHAPAISQILGPLHGLAYMATVITAILVRGDRHIVWVLSLAALAEFERELISERTIAGLAAARARGRKGGRPYKMTPAKVRLAMASMGQPDTNVGELCRELGIARQTLYRHVSPSGELREAGHKVLAQSRSR